MSDNFRAKDALLFKEKMFEMTNELKEELILSPNPIVILLLGPSRSGKSTLANIILNPSLDQKNEVFKTDEGNSPVTMQIQYLKVPLSYLIKKHNLNLNVSHDLDLFLFDCEGFDSLGNATESLRKSVFTFLQISTINIFVSKMIDKSNIGELKAFFSLPKLICGSKQLNKGTAIVLTDSGVPGKPSEDEFETKRKENDTNENNKIMSYLHEKHIDFTKENTSFFAQPKWNNEKHYFESIKDLIKFITNIVTNQFPFQGKTIVQIFDKCIPLVSKLNDLDNSDIRLDLIVDNLINDYFQQSFDFVIGKCPQLIDDVLNNKNANELISLSRKQFYQPIQQLLINEFSYKSNEIYENINQFFPEKYNEFSNKIACLVEEKSMYQLEKLCQSIVIPFIAEQVMNSTKVKICNDISQSYNHPSISDLIDYYQHSANDLFDEQLHVICDNLISTPSYNSQIKMINSYVAQQVVIIEQNERIRKLEEERQIYNDSFDLLKVAAKISQNRVPGQNQITVFAFGRNRTFNLDDNGNVIIRNRAILRKTYQFRMNWDFEDEKISEYPAQIICDFVNGKIYPRVENQVLTTHLGHWKRSTFYLVYREMRRKTERVKWELTIELFDGFVFKETMSPIFILKSPQIDFCEPKAPAHNNDQSVKVPTELHITLI